MVLDSSVLVALILGEPEAEILQAKIDKAIAVGLGAPTLVETLMVLARRLGGDPMPLHYKLLREMDAEVIPFSEEHSRIALEADLRFGKGRHAAALNFGDCLAYATASIANEPLLYVGNDFSQTDLASA